MNQRRIFLLALAVFLMVALACTRSASGPMPQVSGAEQPAGLPTQVVLQPAAQPTTVAQEPVTPAPLVEAPTPTPMAPPPTPVPPTPVPPQPTPVPQQPTPVPPQPTPIPPTATPVPPTAPPAAGEHTVPSEYVLRAGEFPYCIARRFNIHPDDLLAANGISPWQYYFGPGTRLRIPQNARPFTDFAPRALQPHPTTYTVHGSNETLYSIACKFGDVWPEDIAAANGLPLNDAPLPVGTVLHIP